MTSGVGNTLTLGYDALLRPQSRAVSGVYQKRQNYTNFGTDRQSGQLNYLNYFKADGTTPKLGYRYLYDAGGNIKEVKSKTGSNALATESTFQYDKLGQLTKVTGKTNETYTYDTAGNMLSRTWSSGSYSYLTSYLYENTAWGDLLTSYKGQKLAYEGQTYVSTTSVTGTPKSGNPISYYNGTRWTMGWQGANQLISASSSGKSLSFTYDVNGLRTSKTYNGTKYQYAYAGDRLLWQGWSGNEMFFFYDEQGAPFAFRHVSSSGTVTVGYYFLNGQGDVVQIENASGTVLATYSYDPWGKPISSTGTFASINPLRYRGYYYDTETGFYYLQNRYYDPTISRFINADSYAATGGLLGYNMFAYCENDPVNALDSSGSYPIEVGDNPDRRPAAAVKPTTVSGTGNSDSIGTKIWNTVQAFMNSATVSGGFGSGFQVSAAGPVSVEAGAKYDLLAFEMNCKKGVRIGHRSDIDCSIGLPGWDSELGTVMQKLFHLGYSEHMFTSSVNIGWCEKHSYCECPLLETDSNPRAFIGLSASLYFIVGFSFDVGFDLNYFSEDLERIWN